MASAGTSEMSEGVKNSIRAVLLSKIGGVLLSHFSKDYSALLNEPVQYVKYGHDTLEKFLRAMPDVVRFEYSDLNKDWRLFGIGAANMYMSGPAIKAQGKPGQDVDKLEVKGSNRRGHGGGGKFNQKSFSGMGTGSSLLHMPKGHGSKADSSTSPGLIPNHKGLYTICCAKPTDMDTEAVVDTIRTVAPVAEDSTCNNLIFVRFRSKEEAMQVMNRFKDVFRARPAMDKLSGQPRRGHSAGDGARQSETILEMERQAKSAGRPLHRVHAGGDSVPQNSTDLIKVYLGNLTPTTTQEEIRTWVAGLDVKNVKICPKEDKIFAFVSFPTTKEAIHAVDMLHNKMLSGCRQLVCRLANLDPMDYKTGQIVPREGIETVTELVRRGHSLEGARKAVYNTNNSGIEDAVKWILQHQNDRDFNCPLLDQLSDASVTMHQHQLSDASASVPDDEAVVRIMSLGVTKDHASRALRETRNNVEEAAEWIVNHMNELTMATPLSTPQSEQSRSEQRTVGTAQRTMNPRDSAMSKSEQPHQATSSNWPATVSNSPSPPVPVMKPAGQMVSPVKAIPEPSTTAVVRRLNGEFTNGPDLNAGGGVEVGRSRSPEEIPDLVDEDDDDLPDLEDSDDENGGGLTTDDSNSIFSTEESESSTVSIFVGNFPYETPHINLLEEFYEYEPLRITMVNNSNTQRSTYAFISLPSAEHAERAILEKDFEEFYGRRLLVGNAFNEPGCDYEDMLTPVLFTPQKPDVSVTKPVDGESSELEVVPSSAPATEPPETIQLFASLLEAEWPHCCTIVDKLYGEIHVLVTSVLDDQFFWGQLLSEEEDLEILSLLNEDLTFICQSQKANRKPRIGKCAAYFEETWFRAWNMGNVGTDRQYGVLFVDYGNIELLECEDIRRTDMTFWDFPPQAKPFQLAEGSLKDLENIEAEVATLEVVVSNGPGWGYVTTVRLTGVREIACNLTTV